MNLNGEFEVCKSYFSDKPLKLFSSNEFRLQAYKYNSGVNAIKLENNSGFITVLPFMGQMIWDAVFNGRNLAMKTTFAQPVPTDFFLYTYGAFLIHCGALRMGCPGPGDDHPLHGELPCARYNNVRIIFGEDERGPFTGITGIYEYNIAFGPHYRSTPIAKLYADSSIFEITIKIENLSFYPMELMYMAHVNLRAVINSRIVQSLGWTKNDLVVRESIPSHVKVPEGYREFIEKLKENPELTKIIKPEDIYRPEVVFSLRKPDTDNYGWSHFMQVHPDGTSDYISYRPEEFDHASRWFCINEDKQALGLALPATADAEGYTAEKKKGNIKTLDGGAVKSFTVITGFLDKKESVEKENYITSIMT